ncbi:MAG: VWA domain-containing protein [Syntrophomonadaceae bacterium]|nr:VWA domain-containing protein [Syntrophomonadaceae bacterium]
MAALLDDLTSFINDLRQAGIPIAASQLDDCFRSLLLVDWSLEPAFHAAISSTLVKDAAWLPVFEEIYGRHFYHFSQQNQAARDRELHALRNGLQNRINGTGSQSGSVLEAGQFSRNPDACQVRRNQSPRLKNPITQDFYGATWEEIRRMEAVFPLLARRLATRMVKKRRRNQNAQLDYRRTMRYSLSTGGVPLNLFVNKREREKPVIVALCDVSDSCLHYSFFSLALVHSLERFFRQVRSFAFIDQTDEVTSLLKQSNFSNLRSQVLLNADTVGDSGYTDYGAAWASFLAKYGDCLTPRTTVLIFGDGRTNWFPSRSDLLKEIKSRVRKVYWMVPETEDDWAKGDSSMESYKKHCDQVFECLNLDGLTRALAQL